MRRDLDLVRSLLLAAEESDGAFDALRMPCKFTEEEIAFHVELMTAHGLIEAKVERGFGGMPTQADIDGLTWEGFDYLDAIRSPKVWKASRDAIAKAVGDTSLSVVKETCTMVATKLIRQALDS